MSISGVTVWLNPLIMVIGLVTLVMLQMKDKPVARVVYTTEAPSQAAQH